LDFDIDKVINTYHTFENQKPGLDKLLEEKEVFVPAPEQLKDTRVRQYAFHNKKTQAEAKKESHHLDN
jgi:hypothetical protein